MRPQLRFSIHHAIYQTSRAESVRESLGFYTYTTACINRFSQRWLLTSVVGGLIHDLSGLGIFAAVTAWLVKHGVALRRLKSAGTVMSPGYVWMFMGFSMCRAQGLMRQIVVEASVPQWCRTLDHEISSGCHGTTMACTVVMSWKEDLLRAR